MYLMHMLAANAVRPILGHQFGFDVFVGTTATVTLAAYLSFRYFETPILRQKSRFATDRVTEVEGIRPVGQSLIAGRHDRAST